MSKLPNSPGGLEAQAHIDDQIAELQQTISDLQAQVWALRTQRNAFSPICRLPSEVLSIIFIHHAQMHHGSSKKKQVVPECVNISYVCRHWRDVALSCPELWSYISAASKQWTAAFLLRSSHAPLKICLKPPFGRHIVEKLLDHTERVEELSFRIPDYEYERLFSMFSSPAPLLRSLVVHVHRPYNMTPATSPFFNGIFPALRRLELSACLPRPAPMLGNLTTLILRDAPHAIPDLATALCAMHRLEHLELCDALGEPDAHSMDDVGELRFPHLLRLAIEDSFIACLDVVKFLSCFKISSQTEVRIHVCQAYGPEWLSFRSVLAKTFFASGDKSQPPIHTLAIDYVSCSDFTTFVFSGSEIANWKLVDKNWGSNIPLQITISGDGGLEIVQEIIHDAYRNGFLSNLQGSRITISLEDWDEDPCSPLLQDTFGFIPKLRYIRLIAARKALRCLLSFLSLYPHPPDESTPDDAEKPLPLTFAPGLEELVIDTSVFESDQVTWGNGCYDGCSVSNLYDALALRKDNGYTLRRLTLSRCSNVSEEDVTKLKESELVGEVVWDGFVRK